VFGVRRSTCYGLLGQPFGIFASLNLRIRCVPYSFTLNFLPKVFGKKQKSSERRFLPFGLCSELFFLDEKKASQPERLLRPRFGSGFTERTLCEHANLGKGSPRFALNGHRFATQRWGVASGSLCSPSQI